MCFVYYVTIKYIYGIIIHPCVIVWCFDKHLDKYVASIEKKASWLKSS